MKRDQVEEWIIWVFAVAGAFVLCGMFGLVVSHFSGVDDDATSGFFAAFGVVILSFLAAPRRPMLTAIISYLVGSLLAWGMIRSDLYSSGIYGYVLTLVGGTFALLLCVFPFSRRKVAT